MNHMKKGNELYELLLRLGGMDRVPLENEIQRLMDRLNLDSTKLTMNDLRRVALAYLEEISTRVCTKPSSARRLTGRLRSRRTRSEELAEA